MAQLIHITEARKLLNSGRTVDLDVWKLSGEIIHIEGCSSLRYSFYGGHRNVKIKKNGQIRRIRDVLIFRINGLEVYL